MLFCKYSRLGMLFDEFKKKNNYLENTIRTIKDRQRCYSTMSYICDLQTRSVNSQNWSYMEVYLYY